MGWQQQYRSGSWRGVPFVTMSHGADFGRRKEHHEFPFRDQPWPEDLGRQARSWTLSVFVIGADYMAQRDALIAAIEAPGVGTLVHPWLGTFQAHIYGKCHLTETTSEGGMARFDLVFVERGNDVSALSTPDTQGASVAAATKVKAKAVSRFAAAFATIGQAAFVISKSAAFLGSVAQVIQSHGPLAVLVSGVGALNSASALTGGDALSQLSGGLATLNDANALIGQAGALANAAMGAVIALGAFGASPPAQIAAITGVMTAVAGLPVGGGATVAQAQLAANNQASIDLTVAACAVALGNVVPTIAFASYDDAAALRQTLSDALDCQATAANDRGNVDLAHDLDHVRRAIAADITARGGSLAPLISYTPASVRPAVSIAWSVYGDAVNVFDEEAEIVARNAVMHPLFVPVSPLQMVSADG